MSLQRRRFGHGHIFYLLLPCDQPLAKFLLLLRRELAVIPPEELQNLNGEREPDRVHDFLNIPTALNMETIAEMTFSKVGQISAAPS